ncbi:MAG TPA: COX15/CtaA family protein [Phycisphaerae bacterium]|nr:COX15/CtaA family protein [Phycisphaerae bacterium]
MPDPELHTQIPPTQFSHRYTKRRSHGDAGDILAIALGTATGMWTTGYVCRMPGGVVPAQIVLVLMFLWLIGAGVFAAMRTSRGWLGGLWVGLVTGLFNLLILGSLGNDLTSDQRILAYAMLWGPASIGVCGILGSVGAWIGTRFNSQHRQYIYPEGAFTAITACCVLVLITVGGMVTGLNAGLSVPDWPNSFDYGMFLFPLSHMTGGVYFEHTHRLMGTLVGLATLIQTIYLFRHERRGWIKALALTVFFLVVGQGIMGGLRVTGHFTLSDIPEAMAPNTTLAIVHGAFAQVLFALMTALAAFCSRTWISETPPKPRLSARIGRLLNWALVAVLLVQLLLGSVLRHVGHVLPEHITVALVALMLAILCGARAWGVNLDQPILGRLGAALLCVVLLQIMLGVCAVIVIGGEAPLKTPGMGQAIITTAHQVSGAVLLAIAVLLALWSIRLESPVSMEELSSR